MSATLVLEFSGWCIIRLPTDPDPGDEPRGVSGYTFAFGDEPDLDRVIHLQPPADFEPRSYGPKPLGVRVTEAQRVVGDETAPVEPLRGATVELLGQPRFENRNWILTLPGFEPIYPFDLRIAGDGLEIRRSAPFDPSKPDMPLWEVPEDKLLAHGAQGMEFEPQTVGQATNVWDQLGAAAKRLELLKADLAKEKAPAAIAVLEGRIAELQFAVDFAEQNGGRQDRRTMAHSFVERFAFPMLGTDAQVVGAAKLYLGALDLKGPWMISFWLGGWDPDLLCAYLSGSLQIPYSQT
jgi:hypothetical protein